MSAHAAVPKILRPACRTPTWTRWMSQSSPMRSSLLTATDHPYLVYSTPEGETASAAPCAPATTPARR